MATQRERVAANKRAFDEIIGDPYSKHDLAGQYMAMRSRSSVKAVDNSIENQSTQGTSGNAARPNVVDFLCDVDCAIHDGVRKYAKQVLRDGTDVLEEFYKTYLTQDGEFLLQRQRADIEQIVGQILIARKISPAIRYFTALRQRKITEGKGRK